jgi:indolepyruvate ferredoxin oxidoreductase alpha subunit
VSYVGGYQGAPVSHLLDVMVQARDYLDDLGVHVEACTSEASAAAMLGASINYPARGAVTWKSIVGTNVAAGRAVLPGERRRDGRHADRARRGITARAAWSRQERSHAFALKSLMWLLDPRPNLSTIVDMVEKGFQLSEASNTPVMMELRIRACHVRGVFSRRKSSLRRFRRATSSDGPPKEFIYDRLAHPPATFRQEKLKSRRAAARSQRIHQEKRLK